MWPHTATVRRTTRTVAGGRETVPGPATVYAALPCLAEGLSAWKQGSVFGDIGGYTLMFSYPSSAGELYEDDEVTLAHKPGKVYYFRPSVDDTHRTQGSTIEPYYVGVLAQEPIQRM